jgi:hypothetical protein
LDLLRLGRQDAAHAGVDQLREIRQLAGREQWVDDVPRRSVPTDEHQAVRQRRRDARDFDVRLYRLRKQRGPQRGHGGRREQSERDDHAERCGAGHRPLRPIAQDPQRKRDDGELGDERRQDRERVRR